MDWSTVGTAVGIAAGCTGVYVAYRTYVLKLGARFRGDYTVTSSVYCEDEYVSRVVIENAKDRAITIFGIYLRLGFSLYLTIDDFGDAPLLLRGFETFQRDYDPVDCHLVGMKRVGVGKLLKDRGTRKQLVLSTSCGRQVVRKGVKHWDPIVDFFRNYMTGIISPVRHTYKGRAYGSNAAYLVELELDGGTKEVIPIYLRDYQIRRFRSFMLTKESLESKSALEALLTKERQAGHLHARSVSVLDLGPLREDLLQEVGPETVELTSVGPFTYFFGGRALTRIENRRVRTENNRRASSKDAAGQQTGSTPPGG